MYQTFVNYGIISNKLDNQYTKYGRVLPLNKLNRILFGTDNIPITVSLLELEKDGLVVNINDKYYYIVDTFDKVIKKIGTLENQHSNYILINYYNLIQRELFGFNKDINNWWRKFIEFIDNDKSLRKDKHKDVVKDIVGTNIFNGIIHQHVDNMYTISFDTTLKPYCVTFGYDDIMMKNYVNLNDYNFNKFYKELVEIVLLSSPDNYILINLAKITKSKEFAGLILQSYKEKNNHVIPVSLLEYVVMFKDNMMKNSYNEYYKTKISNEHWTIIDDEMYLNFRGLNKYFLTLDEKYLISFEMKEMINDFYTNITDELIKSYQTLFEFYKN